MRMLGDDEPFDMYPLDGVGRLVDLPDSMRYADVERWITENVPDAEHRMSDDRHALLQFYCIRGPEVFAVMCRLSNKDRPVLNFLRYLALHGVAGHYRTSIRPNLLDRVLRRDPWGLWATVSPQDAASRVAEWDRSH